MIGKSTDGSTFSLLLSIIILLSLLSLEQPVVGSTSELVGATAGKSATG